MSERKVLNKYYPPDFDPSKIPRMKLAKNRQYTVRLMAPFNMRCVTCGEYIYKGKKFNARKEDVEGQDYLGIRIYRFYIKCTRCLQEISFKTDPQNTDYEIEAGATRNFMALKLAEEQAQKEEDERKEDESTNPMKLLENRTKQSKQELELLESLEELRDLNRRQRAVDYDQMLDRFDTRETQRQMELKQEEEDEKYIKSVFGAGKSNVKVVEEVVEADDVTVSKKTPSFESTDEPPKKVMKVSDVRGINNVEVKTTENIPTTSELIAPPKKIQPVSFTLNKAAPIRSATATSKKSSMSSLVRLKPSAPDLDTLKLMCGPVPATTIPSNADILGGSSGPVPATTIPSNADILGGSSGPVPATTIPSNADILGGSSGLSLLGAYSGSDSDSDNG